MSNGKFKRKINPFTQISNFAILDTNLSSKALGLYVRINYYLMIPDFDLYKNFLMKQFKEGQKAFDSAWKELKVKGYLIQHKLKDDKAHYTYEYELLDKPVIDVNNPDPQKGGVEKEGVEKGVCINKTLSNNINNKENLSIYHNKNNNDTSQPQQKEIDGLTEQFNSVIEKAELEIFINEQVLSDTLYDLFYNGLKSNKVSVQRIRQKLKGVTPDILQRASILFDDRNKEQDINNRIEYLKNVIWTCIVEDGLNEQIE